MLLAIANGVMLFCPAATACRNGAGVDVLGRNGLIVALI
jgi:hypothetical protein